MTEDDLEMEEHKKALASIIEADPHSRGGPLTLVFFGIVTAKLDPVFFSLDHAIKDAFFSGEDWFDDYVAFALKMGTMLAVQRFGIDPVSFPGRLAVFLDGAPPFISAPPFIPALLVGDRLITWDSVERGFCATEKPARASVMRAAFDWAESHRMEGEATQ